MTTHNDNRGGSLNAAGNSTKAPFLLMSAAPLAGHTEPLLYIAKELVKRGFEGIFLSTLEFKEKIERLGMEFRETSYYPLHIFTEVATIPLGLPRVAWDMEMLFINSIHGRTERLRKVLEEVHKLYPGRQVIIVSETFGFGALPLLLGAPLPRGYHTCPKVININVVPLLSTSIDTAPWGLGLPPDSSDSGRLRNMALKDLLIDGIYEHIIARNIEVLKSLGCTRIPDGLPMDCWLSSYDTTFQMCSQSLEYPRSDLNNCIRFAGALPKRGLDSSFPYPEWWSEITANSELPSLERKKVIPVVQGTVAVSYDELAVPAIKALANRGDVIVVVILGMKGATLPNSVEIPANVRVADYLPYDAALEHADVLIGNGGYGSLVHAVNNGVPLLLAGISEDKMEVAARAEWAGLAVNLKTQNPTPEQISDGISKVFSDPSYKRAAIRLQKENSDLGPINIIEREIWHYTE